jgi:hypothetical protein
VDRQAGTKDQDAVPFQRDFCAGASCDRADRCLLSDARPTVVECYAEPLVYNRTKRKDSMYSTCPIIVSNAMWLEDAAGQLGWRGLWAQWPWLG